MPTPDRRAFWFANILLAATFVGVGAGVLTWLSGIAAEMAIIAGAGAAGYAITLMLRIRRYFQGKR